MAEKGINRRGLMTSEGGEAKDLRSGKILVHAGRLVEHVDGVLVFADGGVDETHIK